MLLRGRDIGRYELTEMASALGIPHNTVRQPVLRQARAGRDTAAVDRHTFLCHTDGPESAHSGHRERAGWWRRQHAL